MNKFQNGKIYKLLNHVNNEVYVGSTYQPLSKRMSDHRSKARDTKCETPMMEYMREIGIDKFYIELACNYPCNSKEELRAKEGEYIRAIGTLNKRIAGRTQKDWEEEHKEHIRQLNAMRYEKNKDKQSEEKKIYYKDNKEAIAQRSRLYAENHKEQIKEYHQSYYQEKKNSIQEQHARYYLENKDRLRQQSEKYRKNNRELINQKARERYHRNKQNKEEQPSTIDSIKNDILTIWNEHNRPEGLLNLDFSEDEAETPVNLDINIEDTNI